MLVSANMILVMTCAFLIPGGPLKNALEKNMKKHFVTGTKLQRGSEMILKEGKKWTKKYFPLVESNGSGTLWDSMPGLSLVLPQWQLADCFFNVKFPRVSLLFELPW